MEYQKAEQAFRMHLASYVSKKTQMYYDDNLQFFRKYLINEKGSLEFDIQELSKEDFRGYIAYQRKRDVKNTSVCTYARAIKAFLRYLYNEGYLLENVTDNVRFPKSDKRMIIPLSSEQIEMLLDALRGTPNGLRNRIIIKLMLDCGLRHGEVIRLDADDVDAENSFIRIYCSKNCKSRVVPLPEELKNLIIEYREGKDTAPLLLRKNNERITKNAISCIFSKLKKTVPGIYPHLLRHTFATSFVLGGGNLEVLRVLMGHESYDITKEYLHIASQMQLLNYDIYKLDDVFFRVYNYHK